MKALKSIKYGKIIPVKLINNKLVRIREAPSLESKILKNQLDNSVSVSLFAPFILILVIIDCKIGCKSDTTFRRKY